MTSIPLDANVGEPGWLYIGGRGDVHMVYRQRFSWSESFVSCEAYLDAGQVFISEDGDYVSFLKEPESYMEHDTLEEAIYRVEDEAALTVDMKGSPPIGRINLLGGD